MKTIKIYEVEPENYELGVELWNEINKEISILDSDGPFAPDLKDNVVNAKQLLDDIHQEYCNNGDFIKSCDIVPGDAYSVDTIFWQKCAMLHYSDWRDEGEVLARAVSLMTGEKHYSVHCRGYSQSDWAQVIAPFYLSPPILNAALFNVYTEYRIDCNDDSTMYMSIDETPEEIAKTAREMFGDYPVEFYEIEGYSRITNYKSPQKF